jgi:hypothetical protein
MNQKRFAVKKFVAVLTVAEVGIPVFQAVIHSQSKKSPGLRLGKRNVVPTESRNIVHWSE